MIEISSFELDDDSNWNSAPSMKSSNFGGGIELLMNDKVREGNSKMKSDIDIEDLNNLENELNDLADNTDSIGINLSSRQNKSDLFSSSFKEEKHGVRFDDSVNHSLGQSTSETGGDSKTWDGYGKFNNIPINPDKHVSSQPQLSKEELLREKFKYLKKLEALEKKGVELSKKYNMESPLAEMQGEYETIVEEKTKQNSVKFQANMMMTIINGIEFLNNRFDPFDIKLDGWSEQINENVTDYDDIFGELYEKYKTRGSMAPELKLLFQLGGSAMMVHLSNTMFKSSMPGVDDILRQNPDLMKSFQAAAVNSMGQGNPGFSGFMNGIMNPEPSVPSGRGPPPPMATQGYNAVPPPQARPGNNNYAPTNRATEINLNMTRPNFSDDGINIKEVFGNPSNNFNNNNEKSSRRPQQNVTARAEMKGPSDISDILSGLKTKTINIQEPQVNNSNNINNDSSTISISDLKDLQNDGNMPKKSKRRQKSDKNTVSLDI